MRTHSVRTNFMISYQVSVPMATHICFHLKTCKHKANTVSSNRNCTGCPFGTYIFLFKDVHYRCITNVVPMWF